jgi:hypothetical protein
VNARQIINYIPTELLQKLSGEYNVDFQVKKLDGVSMFKLLLYSFLTTRETSYRVIEEVYPLVLICNQHLLISDLRSGSNAQTNKISTSPFSPE